MTLSEAVRKHPEEMVLVSYIIIKQYVIYKRYVMIK